MKKSKRIIFSLILMISMVKVNSMINVKTTALSGKCKDFALTMLDWVEEDECLDAETATRLYNEFYETCEGW